MNPLIDLLDQAAALLAEAAQVDRRALSDTELVAVLGVEQGVARVLGASQLLTAGEIADRSRFELGAEGPSSRYGERKPVNFIERLTRVSQSEAARRVRVGLQVRPRTSFLGERMPAEHPRVAAAVVAGEIGADSADVVLTSLKHAARGCAANPEALDAAELELVELATHASADLVADAGRLWRDLLDPDGIEPRWEHIRSRRMLTVGREHGGIRRYTIHATPTLSSLLDAALLESMDVTSAPRFLSEDDLAAARREMVDDNGQQVERIFDPRTIGQRQHDILEGVLAAGLKATRNGEPSHRTVGSVTAVISLADLRSGTGFGIFEGVDEVVPASVIQQLACENGYRTVILGRSGKPLWQGRLDRYFTSAQRRAIIARDGDRCVVPGCTRRAASCHAHHVIFASRGGPTDPSNGVHLCPAHHYSLHHEAFELRMRNERPEMRYKPDYWNDDAWHPAGNNRMGRAGIARDLMSERQPVRI